MKYRVLGKTNLRISEVSLGTWQVGGRWGSAFDNKNAEDILRYSIEQGVNFIDTADVYSDGLSEKIVGKVAKDYKGKVFIATKCGRRFNPHIDASYTIQALRKSVEDSLKNMDLETIDLIQLHCPPWETYYRPEVFYLFEKLKEEGKILNLGVSVEKVEQGIKAMQYHNVASIQVIYNMFRQRPDELLFDLAKHNDVGIIARVPLASGLLTGHYTKSTVFEEGDHRTFNREGSAFDKGETFSGVNYELGLTAAKKLKDHFAPKDLAKVAIAWVLNNQNVSCVIPGSSNLSQASQNLQISDVAQWKSEDLEFVRSIYNEYIKDQVHELW
jgi:aryl-alcohol dehydrogenase-like predicted oxidoreductase